MTISLDAPNLAEVGFYLGLLLVVVVSGWTTWRDAKKSLGLVGFSATGFQREIQDLIMVNNIDHAIKLCNSKSHALAGATKPLLTHSRRPGSEWEPKYEEALLRLRGGWTKPVPWLGLVTAVLGRACTVALFLKFAEGLGDYVLVGTAFLFGAMCEGLMRGARNQVVVALPEAELALLETRNLLRGWRRSAVPGEGGSR